LPPYKFLGVGLFSNKKNILTYLLVKKIKIKIKKLSFFKKKLKEEYPIKAITLVKIVQRLICLAL
jgi:hypothetical protein